MATSSISSQYSGLDRTYVSMINDIMTVERQPLTRLTSQRDDISVQKAIYNDLNGMLTGFQSSVKALISSEASYSFQAGRKASFSGMADGVSFGSVSVSSSAITGSYNISVTNLAQEHRVRSDRQAYSSQALGLTGSFLIGGTAASALANAAANATVTAFSTTEVQESKTELGTGTYYVETRNDSASGWQFRLVDADGKAVSIKKADGSSDYTSEWQSIPSGGGEIDTGRGLSLTLAADSGSYTAGLRGSGAAQVDYTAKGATLEIEAGDSLVDIASKINNAKYAEGNDVVATIVDNQLILSSKLSGEDHAVVASDVSGTVLNDLGILTGTAFKNQMQAGLNANFSVNGLNIERSQNTGLTDVINGVTLTLLKDSEGQSATLSVEANPDDERKDVNSFVSEFNKLLGYLSAKTATTKNSDDTYKRGALAGDMVFSSLRYDLLRLTTSGQANSGSFTRLSEIGLTMDDNLKLTLSDSAKFEAAVLNNRSSVVSLLDAVMSQMDSKVSRFLGTSGYLTTATSALERREESTNSQISTLESRLSKREESLYQQYAQLQAQLMTMTYQSQQFNAMYGSISQMY